MPEIIKEHSKEKTVFDKMNKSFKKLFSEVKCKHGYIFQKSKLRKLEYPKEMLISFNETYVIGKGGFGTVYHAYWPLKKKCVAFKSTCKFGGKREIQVLNYFKNLGKLNPNESKYIAEMYGYVELKEKFAIALELGQNNLRGYYFKNIVNGNNRYLFSSYFSTSITKLLKGAAKALEQFHKHGIHLDIKADNFIISQEQNEGDNVIVCKLIDFNTAFLYKHHNFDDIRIENTTDLYKAPEIRNNDKMKLTRRVDVWAFGLMSYKLLYTLSVKKPEDLDNLLNEYRNNLNKTSRLDRIIKACIQINEYKRPSMKAINNFLNGECHAFNYEKENFKNVNICEDDW